MTRVGRWIKRGLLLALFGFTALQSWYFLHIVYWRYANPHLTSFMAAGACVALILLLRDRGEGGSGLSGLRIAVLAAVPGICLSLAYWLMHPTARGGATWVPLDCLLYTSDAADE